MIPKWAYVEVEDGECTSLGVTEPALRMHLGWWEAEAFLAWYKKHFDKTVTIKYKEPAYFGEAVQQWRELRRCTSEHPNPDSDDHEFEYSHIIDEDHGDEVWYCKHCRKRQVREGPDA